jgi:hypothetical protein
MWEMNMMIIILALRDAVRESRRGMTEVNPVIDKPRVDRKVQ